MKLSVIIPCFNEEKTISKIIEKVKKNITENDEIIAIDDCSNDNTKNILESELKKKKYKSFNFK